MISYGSVGATPRFFMGGSRVPVNLGWPLGKTTEKMIFPTWKELAMVIWGQNVGPPISEWARASESTLTKSTLDQT